MSGLIRPDRVAVYIRWSTDDQGDGTTLEVQQDACTHFILSQGWTRRKDLVFVDDGCSGGNLRRPALTALRRAVLDGQVDCVVCFKLDRLSRCVVDTVNLVLEEWEGRCFFKSAREPIDTTTPAGKMFFYLLASYAEWERNVIRERTAGGRLQRAQQGFWAAGTPPYGYRLDAGKRLRAEPAEAAVVRGIYDGYCQGQTIAEIVRRLQAEGAPAPGGPGRWGKPLVRRILGLPIYMGVLEYGRNRANPRHGRQAAAPRRLKAEAPAVQLPGAAPAIVDAAVFWTVQKLKAERDGRRSKASGRAYSSPWLLSGLARCARCGASLAVRAGRQGRWPYYHCTGRTAKLQCDAMMIRLQDLDDWFVAELKRVYGDQVRRRRLLADLQAQHQGRRQALQAGQAALQEALAQLERERATIRRRLRADEISAADYQQLMAEIDAALAGHRQRRQTVTAALARLTAAPAAVADLAAVDIFESLGPQERKRLVARLAQSLTVYRDPAGGGSVQARVVWRLPGEGETPPAAGEPGND